MEFCVREEEVEEVNEDGAKVKGGVSRLLGKQEGALDTIVLVCEYDQDCKRMLR